MTHPTLTKEEKFTKRVERLIYRLHDEDLSLMDAQKIMIKITRDALEEGKKLGAEEERKRIVKEYGDFREIKVVKGLFGKVVEDGRTLRFYLSPHFEHQIGDDRSSLSTPSVVRPTIQEKQDTCMPEQTSKIFDLTSDINRAIGRMRGLGHPDRYLEEKYSNPSESELSGNSGQLLKEDMTDQDGCGACCQEHCPFKKGVQSLNISHLRQWLNEDRITDPKKIVTNEEIMTMLGCKSEGGKK